MKAYKGIVIASPGRILVGGGTRHESYPMETYKMAQDWVSVVAAENYRNGEHVVQRRVELVEAKNPIRESEVQ